jgi:hypothetical protein
MTTDNQEGGGQPIYKSTQAIKARQGSARKATQKTTAAAKARAANARQSLGSTDAAAARNEAARNAVVKPTNKKRSRPAAKRNPLKNMGTIIDQVASATGGVRPGPKAIKAHAKARADAKLRQQRDIDSQVMSATSGSTLVGTGRTANPRLPTVLKSDKARATDNPRSIKSQVASASGGGKPARPPVPMRDVNVSPKGPTTTQPPWPSSMSAIEFIVGGTNVIGKPLTEAERKKRVIGLAKMDKILSQLRAASGGQTPNFTALREVEKRRNELSKSQRRELESQIQGASGGINPRKQKRKGNDFRPTPKLASLPPVVPAIAGSQHIANVRTFAASLPAKSTVIVGIKPTRRSAVASVKIGRELSFAGHIPVPVLAVDRKLTIPQVDAVIDGLQKSDIQAIAVLIPGNRSVGKVKSAEVLTERLEKAGVAVAVDVAPASNRDKTVEANNSEVEPADPNMKSVKTDPAKSEQPKRRQGTFPRESGEKSVTPTLNGDASPHRQVRTISIDVPPGQHARRLQYRQGGRFKQIDLQTGQTTTMDRAVNGGVKPGVTPQKTLKVIETQRSRPKIQKFDVGSSRGFIERPTRVTFT